MDDRSRHGINDYAARLIRFKARQIALKAGFRHSDEDDIEQSLILRVLQALPQFDPGRAQLNTFIDRVIAHEIASLLRHRRADKRSPRREECSLNDAVSDGEGCLVARHQTIPEAGADPLRQHDLESDLANVLNQLPSVLRLVALGLANGTVASIAREHGMSRHTVNQHIQELRRACEDGGLREYLR